MNITILTPEELAERDQRPQREGGRAGRPRSEERTRIIEEYKALLRDAPVGFGGDVELAPGEEKRIVRDNLKAAAAELDLALEFRPRKDRTQIQFRVITPEEYAAKPKRGGRPRKHPQPAPVLVLPDASPVWEDRAA